MLNSQAITDLIDNEQVIQNYIRDCNFKYNPKTVNAYVTAVKSLLATCQKNFNSIEEDDVREWVFKAKQSGKQLNTIRNMIISIRNFARYCLSEGIISRDFTLRIKVPQLEILAPKIIDSASIYKLRLALEGDIQGKLIFELLYSSGIKVLELINIQVDDVNLEPREVLIRSKDRRRTRIVYITEQVAEMIRDYLNSTNCKDGYLLKNQKSQPLSRFTVQRILKQVSLKAGLLNSVTSSNLRNTFAANLADKGVPLEIICYLLGVSVRGFTRHLWVPRHIYDKYLT